MGDVIPLQARRFERPDRSRPPATRISFYFDLSSPWTYLAADRVDRYLGSAVWRPALGGALFSTCDERDHGGFRGRRAAERRAVELGVPLVWPELWPASGRAAMRVATLAARHGCAAPFVLAAGRLAFCGGYDLDDPEILAEAAAAAGLGLREALDAAVDAERDHALEAATLDVLALGGDELPAFAIGDRLLCGEHQLAAAVGLASQVIAAHPRSIRLQHAAVPDSR